MFLTPTRRQALLTLCLLTTAFLGAADSFSKDSPIQVLPWNGSKAAISLTYDDGDPIHLDLAIPEMNSRKLRGTFFLISNKTTREREWQDAVAAGYEIGNHSVNHLHANELKPAQEKSEVTEARKTIEKLAGKPVLGFAYPFVEISPGLKKWVEANAIVARGGGGANNYMTPGMDPDWMNIPSQATMTAYAYDTYKDWVDQVLSRGAWTVLMIHAIEGSNMWQPVPKDTFIRFLDYLVQNQDQLWIAPFSEVGAYWKAQKTLESIDPGKKGEKTILKWKKPALFPKDVILKVRIMGEGLKVTQGGKPVEPITADIYPVRFDAQELTLQNAAWRSVEASAGTTPLPEKAPVLIASTAPPAGDILKLDDFESSAPLYGTSWWTGCDANGDTKLEPNPFATLPGGSPQSPGHCAGMKGKIGPPKEPWPWAILSLALGAGPIDLTGYQAIRFNTKGDGKAHVVSLNKGTVTDYCDFSKEFVSPKEWTRVTLPFKDFAQAEWGKQLPKKFDDVTKITFTPGAGPDFDFQVDDVELLKVMPKAAGDKP